MRALACVLSCGLALAACRADDGPRAAPVAAAALAPASPPPVDAAGAEAVDAGVPGVSVRAARGRVERLERGAWRPVVAGEALSAHDRVRTGPDGEATLIIDAVGTVVLAPRSDFEVGRRTQELVHLQLGRGRLHADVDGRGGLPLRIAIRDSDAVAEARDGAFSVLTTGGGDVAVATERGAVEVTAVARTVRVDAGQVSVVAAGAPPSSPRAIPPSLILKIAHGPREVATREITISGRTAPGAVVTLAGARLVTTSAAEDGRFTARVELGEGHNRVAVEALDPLGRTARDSLPVIVDTRPPDVEAEVRWGP